MKTVTRKPFSKEILHIEDIESFCSALISKLRNDIAKNLQRRGGIVGISGGIDSSVVLALSAKALGSNNILGIMLPEQDSSNDSKMLSRKISC